MVFDHSFYWRDFQWKLRWGKCEESTIALLFLFLRRISPSLNLDYRSTESKEWLSRLEQISSVRITKNRNWRADALPWLLPSQPQRKSPDHLKKKMRQSRILIGELMPALVPSPLLVCFTGTIFARKSRVPMNPRKKAHYGHDQLKITGHLTTWTRTTISPFSRSRSEERRVGKEC